MGLQSVGHDWVTLLSLSFLETFSQTQPRYNITSSLCILTVKLLLKINHHKFQALHPYTEVFQERKKSVWQGWGCWGVRGWGRKGHPIIKQKSFLKSSQQAILYNLLPRIEINGHKYTSYLKEKRNFCDWLSHDWVALDTSPPTQIGVLLARNDMKTWSLDIQLIMLCRVKVENNCT